MEKKIIWVDDEIDMLKPHIIFLEKKGFQVNSFNNGDDAISFFSENDIDLVLLDEMMPGKDGLTVAEEMNNIKPNVPIIMVTKNEEEQLMEQAISANIDDYVLKPVNPVQILVAVKKLLDTQKIKSNQMGQNYVTKYRELQSKLFSASSIEDWYFVFNQLTIWEEQLEAQENEGLLETHRTFFKDAEHEFFKYITKKYPKWMKNELPNRPELSVDVLTENVFPKIEKGKKVFFMVLDCMNLGQWYVLEKMLKDHFYINREFYLSILPTATPYSRNGIFSGLFPEEIYHKFRKYWRADENSYNKFEEELLHKFLDREGLNDVSANFYKVFIPSEMDRVTKEMDKILTTDLSVLIYNFLDIIVHKRDRNQILTEIISGYKGMRSLTQAWFENSYLLKFLKELSSKDVTVIITTDHGSIVGQKPCLARGNKMTSTSVRYKYGTNLFGEKKKSVLIKNPNDYRLPLESPSMNYLFAVEDYYFVYPNNYNEYEDICRGSFLHGGISMHEMILPIITLNPRG